MRQLRILFISKPSTAHLESQLQALWSAWEQDKLSLYRTTEAKLSESTLGLYEQIQCERLLKKAEGSDWSASEKIWKDEFAVVICEGTSAQLTENFQHQDTVIVDAFNKAEDYLKKLNLRP